jgi:hypothetical protein
VLHDSLVRELQDLYRDLIDAGQEDSAERLQDICLDHGIIDGDELLNN